MVASGGVARVPAERVLLRDLNQDDAHAIRVCNPQFVQASHLAPRLPHDRPPGAQQPSVLGSDVSDLHPQRDRIAGWARRPATDLEQAVTQEAHDAGRVIAAELPVDRQAERVSIEPVTPVELGRTQQDAAAEPSMPLIIHRRQRSDRVGVAPSSVSGSIRTRESPADTRAAWRAPGHASFREWTRLMSLTSRQWGPGR